MKNIPIVNLPSIAILNSSRRFPVRRIFCVGQNYADHAREMGADPSREAPFFFCKPGDAVLDSGQTVPFPMHTQALHHEVELVVALARGGSSVEAAGVPGLIFGSAVGLDLTRRDLQTVAKQTGRPWDMAKGFDYSAPMGPLTEGALPAQGEITLSIDGHIRQRSNLTHMIWGVSEIIATLSTYVALAPGDLIFTGTPAGVGPIAVGEWVRGHIEGLDPVEVRFEGADSLS